MISQEKIRATINLIEQYRKAYWEHKDPQLVKEKRYRPLASYTHTTSFADGQRFSVALYDTWIDFDRPSHFYLAKDLVENSVFTNTDLSFALNDLLNFARVQFMSDQLFNTSQS